MTIDEVIMIIPVLKKFGKNYVVGSAEHDQIWIDLTDEEVPKSSDDGKILSDAGFHLEDGMWTHYI